MIFSIRLLREINCGNGRAVIPVIVMRKKGSGQSIHWASWMGDGTKIIIISLQLASIFWVLEHD